MLEGEIKEGKRGAWGGDILRRLDEFGQVCSLQRKEEVLRVGEA